MSCSGSSLRFKTNVKAFRSGLDVVQELNPICFNWKGDGQPDIGLAAEDVANVAPSFTFTNSEGAVEGVKYERLSMVLINAVKEQQTEIEGLRRANETLNERLKALEKAVVKETAPNTDAH